MKVLITGVNPISTGHIPKLNYISSLRAVKMSLESMGHTVESRPVILGETLAEYDWVIVYLFSMRGFLSVHTLSTLWALHTAAGKCTVSFDDWQTRETMIGIRNFSAERDKIIANNPFGYKQLDKFPEYKVQLWATLDELLKPNWPWPVLIPAYSGGDLSLLQLPHAKMFTYNPSILFKGVYGWVDGADIKEPKRREWVLAALHDHRSWLKKQEISWPVLQFGHRKQGQERIPESEIFSKCTAAYGVLSPAYRIAGSGWWRARYGFAADARCVVVGAPAEMAMVCKDVYDVTTAQVEELNECELGAIAEMQRAEFYNAAGTKEQVYEAIMAAMP